MNQVYSNFSKLPKPAHIAGMLVMVSVALLFAQTTAPITRWIQAENFSARQGGLYSNTTDKEPAISIRDMGGGCWARYDSINFLNGEYDSISFYGWWWENASWANNAVRIRIDSPTSTPIASFNPASNTRPIGEPATFIRTKLAKVTGIHMVFFTVEGNEKWINAFDKLKLSGAVTVTAADARTYYVAAYGSDANDGLSVGRAFRTIQKAASVMKPGSTCEIRQGIYRETVKPIYSGIAGAPLTFKAYNGEYAVIDGADPVTGWSIYSGSIYKAKMRWTLDKFHDQLIVDGKMAWVARCPNVNDPYSPHPYKAMDRIRDWTEYRKIVEPIILPTQIVMKPDDWGCSPTLGCDRPAGTPFHVTIAQEQADGALPPCVFSKQADFLKGGLFTFHNNWLSTGIITASNSGASTTTLDAYNTSSMGRSSPAAPGWVSHLLGLLDSPNEWFRNQLDSTLYLWAPDGGDPSHHLVEAKRRLLGFDGRSSQYINLTGLRFMAAAASFEDATNCVIDGCHFKYVSHFDTIGWWDIGPGYWQSPWNPADGHCGIYISGKNNIMKNSSVAVSAGAGVVVGGRDNEITNCIVKECDYGATGAGGITTWRRYLGDPTNEAYGIRLNHNSMSFNCRANIQVGGGYFASGPKDPGRMRIEYNDFGASLIVTQEQGSLSAQNCEGGEASHNWFHGVAGQTAGDIVTEVDMGARKWNVHHNVFWQGRFSELECPTEMSNNIISILRGTSWTFDWGDTAAMCFNNTVVDSIQPGHDDWESLKGFGPNHERWTGVPWPGHNYNNIWCRSDTAPWKFTDARSHDYSLRAGSPAIDKGVVVPGWVDTYKGAAPDLGAYEFGEPRWVAGADWKYQAWEYPPADVATVRGGMLASMRRENLPTLRLLPGRLSIAGLDDRQWSLLLCDIKGAVVERAGGKDHAGAVIDIRGKVAGIYIIKLIAGNQVIIWKTALRKGSVGVAF